MSLSPALAAASSLGTAAVDPWLTVTGVIAVLAYLVAMWLGRATQTPGVSAAFMRAIGVAWAAHALALVVDVFGTGQGARFGFAPAFSATVWLVVGAHLIERRTMGLAAARRVLVVLGAVSTALAVVFPGVVRQAESPWAPLHWSLALVAYGLLGAAVVHAWLLDRADARLRAGTEQGAARSPLRPADGALPVMTLERLTFRFVDVGFIVLTAAIALGAWFALQSTGGWKWLHHKTVFAMAGWGTLALLVAGRHIRGWRGRRATRWVYVGAALLVLAYMGTRFVLDVLLGRSG